jgi:putative PIG3 family NAD(P)H quinone oxidoreductase
MSTGGSVWSRPVRAVVLTEHGGPEVLTVTEVEDPVPGPEEVVVGVVTTAVNRADVLQRMGFYPEPGPPKAHEIPGMELAGRVLTMGSRVTAWSVGDAVMGIVSGGSYAEQVAVHERQLIAVPDALPLRDAGAVPEVYLTAWDALVVQGGLTPGRWALVHAGASGVGTAAIGLCRAIGASVIVTTSSGKVDACRELGADLVVDYTAGEDYVAVVDEATGGRGVDTVLDVVGGDYVDRNIASVCTGGRIVQVGMMGGGRAEVNVGALLPKRASLIGTVLRARPVEEKIALTRRFAREVVVPWFGTGALRPVIDSRYPLDAVADAHRRMESNANIGKIVVEVSDVTLRPAEPVAM